VPDDRGHRIVAFPAPGMAAGDASHGEPGTPPGPVPLDRLERVLRAGRQEPAGGAEDRRDQVAIELDEADQDEAEEAVGAEPRREVAEPIRANASRS
jgi:hypothetical protein